MRGAFTLLKEGCLEGLSPCAMSTLVVFVALLLNIGNTRLKIFVVGSFFVAAVGGVAFYVGLGLVEPVLHATLFLITSRIVYIVISILAIGLGLLEMYDWWIYKKTRDPGRCRIKFLFFSNPSEPKGFIAAGNKSRFFWPALVILGVAGGALFSLLASSCPSRFLTPVTLYALSTQGQRLQVVGALGLYSIGFILPLLMVFVILLGMGSNRCRLMMGRHLPEVQMISSALFLALGVGLLLMFFSY